MGSAASRAKRVAPALVTENSRNVDGSRLFSSHKAPASDPRRSQQDRRQSRESDILSDEEKLEEEVERILGACESTDGGLKKRLFQKGLFSSETCGLCYGKRGQNGSETIHNRGNIRLSQGEGVRGDYRSSERHDIRPKPAIADPVRADLLCTKAALIPGLCDHPSLAMPVFYDASEEDLMNMIEREFG
ncbi:hypothetical protein SRHO_G00132940 [Serrasalmus rhombeus]